MSDYIDTVDIEGVQYGIQDTPTKDEVQTLADGLSFSTQKVDTGRKWINGKTIYSQGFTATLTNPTSSGQRKLFTFQLPNNVDYALSMKGYVKMNAPTSDAGRAYAIPCTWVVNSMSIYFTAALYRAPTGEGTIFIAFPSTEPVSSITIDVQIEYTEA